MSFSRKPILKIGLIGCLITAVLVAVDASGALSGGSGPKTTRVDREAVPHVRVPKPRGNFSLDAARAFTNFPLYDAGDSVEGFPRVAIVRRSASAFSGEKVRQDDVTFLYGSCESIDGDSCSPPLQVQIWNACERYQGVYDIAPDETLSLRNVPAAFYERHTRLELYSSAVTIVLFGQNRDELIRVARTLRGVNRVLAPGNDLPPPADGVRSGGLACQRG